MRATVDAGELRRAVRIAMRAVPRRPVSAVLKNLLVSASSERGVTVTGQDLTLEIEAMVPGAHVQEPGAIAVPAKLLAAVARVGDGTLGLYARDAVGDVPRLYLRDGAGGWSLDGEPWEQYPRLPAPTRWGGASLLAERFCGLLRRVFHAAPTPSDGHRPWLVGVRLERDGREVRLTATDTNQLATAAAPACGEQRRAIAVTLPWRMCAELARLLPGQTGDLRLEVECHVTDRPDSDAEQDRTWDGPLVTELPDGTRLCGRAEGGWRVEWRRSIGEEPAHLLGVDRGALLGALRRVRPAAGGAKQVRLVYRPATATLELVAGTPGRAVGWAVLDGVTCTPEPTGDLAQTLDSAMLLGALQTFTEERLCLGLSGEPFDGRPARIIGYDGDAGALYAQMPIVAPWLLNGWTRPEEEPDAR